MRRALVVIGVLAALSPCAFAEPVAPSEAYTKLLEEFGGVGMEKQMRLAASTAGKHEWSFSMDKGQLEVAPGLAYKVQILGTESAEGGGWLWAWANKESLIPQNLTRAASKVRAEGEKRGVAELTESSIARGRADGYGLAMVAEGLVGGGAIFRASYGLGFVYLLITDAKFPALPAPETGAMADTFTAFVGRMTVDHRRAFTAYARARGFTVADHDVDHKIGLLATHPKAGVLLAQFDESGHVTKLLADEPPPKKSSPARKR